MTFELRRSANAEMARAFQVLEAMVPPPVLGMKDGGQILRYAEQSPYQAIIQKLARYVSGLQSLEALNHMGYLQEQGVIQRTVDDFGEDVVFLVLGLQETRNNGTELPRLHRDFLDRFWQEEFEDGVAPMDGIKPRYAVSRSKMREWVARTLNADPDSPEVRSGGIVQQVYSGFVHGASPHIMEMVGGEPPRFFVNGLRGTSRQEESAYDLWNYSFRGVLTMTQAALAFGNEQLVRELTSFRVEYERKSGTNYRQRDVRPDDTP